MTGKINPARLSVTLGIVISIFILFGTVYKTANFCLGFMHRSADDHFPGRLRLELQPPSGQVYIAIEDAVDTKFETVSDEMATMNLRMQRQEILMETVYTEITGREPPP